MNSIRFAAAVALLCLTGCPTTNSEPPPADDGAADAGGHAGANASAGSGGRAAGGAAGQTSASSAAGAPGGAAGLAAAGAGGAAGEEMGVVTSRPAVAVYKPLAAGCADNTECASGFCVDSVCCDSACDGQCVQCNVATNVGYCTPQITGDDTTSTDSCTGAHTCALPFTFSPSFAVIPACRLKDLQACSASSDCASLNCVTFYVDADGDGYGQAGRTIQLCEDQGAAPPIGYSTQAGDCCDMSADAHPGQTKYFHSVDACGSLDYDCDGKVVTQGGVPLPSTSTDCSETVQEGDSSYLAPTNCH